MRNIVKSITATLLVACCGAAYAEVRFNGFASIYGGMSLAEDESLYGYDDKISFANESLLGLQASSSLSDNLSVTGQFIGRGSDSFNVSLEWAYATYTFTERSDLSFGRLRLPFFKYSEYLDVGYAYPWARTPRDVYGVDFNTLEGLRYNLSLPIGMIDTSFQVIFGQFDQEIIGIPFEFNNVTGFSADITYDWVSFRGGYTLGTLTGEVTGLDQSLAGLGLSQSSIDGILIDEDSAFFTNFGVFVDYDGWLLNAEVIEYEPEDSFLENVKAQYVMIGKRLGDFTLAVTTGATTEDQDYSSVSGLPAAIQAALSEPTGAPIVAPDENTTTSATLRWDFEPGAAFKVEYTTQEYSVIDNQDSDQSDSLISFGVDLVF